MGHPRTPPAVERPDPPNRCDLDELSGPDGYDWTALMAWGDPVVTGAPLLDFDRRSAQVQRLQFGYNNDFLAFVPIAGKNRALMVVNPSTPTPS